MSDNIIYIIAIAVILGVVYVYTYFRDKSIAKKQIEELLKFSDELDNIVRANLLEDISALILSNMNFTKAPIPRIIMKLEVDVLEKIIQKEPFKNIHRETVAVLGNNDSSVYKFTLDEVEIKVFITPISEYYLLEVTNSNENYPSLHTFRTKNEDGTWNINTI